MSVYANGKVSMQHCLKKLQHVGFKNVLIVDFCNTYGIFICSSNGKIECFSVFSKYCMWLKQARHPQEEFRMQFLVLNNVNNWTLINVMFMIV